MGVRKFFMMTVVVVVGVLVCGMLLGGCAQGSGSSAAASGSGSKAAASPASAAASSGASAASKAAAAGVVTAVDPADADAAYGTGTHHAVLTVEGYDPVTITLDADAAPVSVWNFCKLAKQGYYDGKTFYRFVDDFCMQGGTLGNSASGQDTSLNRIKGEFSANGVSNPLADDFKKGVVAMARTSDPNSAGSTFFVTLGSGTAVSQSLDGLYAAFGTIDEPGMAVVDQIVADYLPNVSDRSSGAIADESKQAKITSVQVID